MEHDDRASIATFYIDASFGGELVVVLGESQAHHARVKRLEVGDTVRVTNGAGQLAEGEIVELHKSALDVAVRRTVPTPARPTIHMRVPAGDRERMLWLAEKATELGIASWQVVRFTRSASVFPRGEGQAFSAKVHARMVSALEQSGGAWLPQILPDTSPAALAVDSGTVRIVLDPGGAALSSLPDLDGAPDPVIVFGPEGGICDDELALLRDAGWIAARLASTTLRFETAGIAAVAIVGAAHMLREP